MRQGARTGSRSQIEYRNRKVIGADARLARDFADSDIEDFCKPAQQRQIQALVLPFIASDRDRRRVELIGYVLLGPAARLPEFREVVHGPDSTVMV